MRGRGGRPGRGGGDILLGFSLGCWTKDGCLVCSLKKLCESGRGFPFLLRDLGGFPRRDFFGGQGLAGSEALFLVGGAVSGELVLEGGAASGDGLGEMGGGEATDEEALEEAVAGDS